MLLINSSRVTFKQATVVIKVASSMTLSSLLPQKDLSLCCNTHLHKLCLNISIPLLHYTKTTTDIPSRHFRSVYIKVMANPIQ